MDRLADQRVVHLHVPVRDRFHRRDEQPVGAGASEDNKSSGVTSRRLANKALTIVDYSQGTVAEADLSSWNSTGFTLNWTTNTASTGHVVHYLAIGGYEVSAKVTVAADVSEGGTVLVLGRLLADISRNLPAKPVDIATFLGKKQPELFCTRSAEGAATVPGGYRGVVCRATAMPPIGLGATPRGMSDSPAAESARPPRPFEDRCAGSRSRTGPSTRARPPPDRGRSLQA